jgi:hypothetical protein
VTDANGDYRIIGVEPNDVERRRVRAAVPRAGRGREHGAARPCGLAVHERPAADQRIVVAVRTNLLGLNLPIDPNGVVYNSMARVRSPGRRSRC